MDKLDIALKSRMFLVTLSKYWANYDLMGAQIIKSLNDSTEHNTNLCSQE